MRYATLQEAMQAAGVRDTDLARKTGFTSQHVNRVRRGIAKPSLAFALAVQRELGGLISAESIMAAERAAA